MNSSTQDPGMHDHAQHCLQGTDQPEKQPDELGNEKILKEPNPEGAPGFEWLHRVDCLSFDARYRKQSDISSSRVIRKVSTSGNVLSNKGRPWAVRFSSAAEVNRIYGEELGDAANTDACEHADQGKGQDGSKNVADGVHSMEESAGDDEVSSKEGASAQLGHEDFHDDYAFYFYSR